MFRSPALFSVALLAAFAVAFGSSPPRALDESYRGQRGCGTVPNMGYKDLSGVLKTLPASVRANFNGYPSPIYKSAYAQSSRRRARSRSVWRSRLRSTRTTSRS